MYNIYIYSIPLQKHPDIQEMPLCFWGIPRTGFKFHIGDTGIDQHGCEREPFSGNGRNTSPGKHGWKFVPVYMPGNRNNTECCKKCGAVGGSEE